MAKEIIALRDADLEMRNTLLQSGRLSDGYNPQMNQVHDHNAEKLNVIIEKIGYPTADKVGEEGSAAAWLIIQHAIAKPDFMKKCAKLLEIAVQEKKANPISLAYLLDRIAVFEDRPQLYGTQFDWDDEGQLSPQQYDDITEVNERRKALGLNSVTDQTQIVRAEAKQENQLPPVDMSERKKEYHKWRKSVGWIQ